MAHFIKTGWASSFSRIQISIGFWGAILLVGGWLHNSFSKTWGIDAMLWVWVGLAVLGLVVNFVLAPESLNSSALFVWGVLLALGLVLTWLIIYPLNNNGREYVSTLWHAIFAGGYLLMGLFMDRRLWALAAWELLLALFMGLVAAKVLSVPEVSKNLGLYLGLTSGIPLLIAALPFWQERNMRLRNNVRNREPAGVSR